MQMQEKKVKGFSIIELMIVVAIIGVIATLSFEPFLKWRGDRAVRTEALNITSIIKNIFAQVQRGNYSFVQFVISRDDSSTYSVSSNGMGIENFIGLVRDKYDGSTLKPFHNFETRCAMAELDLLWDHKGDTDENILTVNEIFINSKKIGISVNGSDVTEDGGKVCFSKDGTYYSPSGIFLDDTTPIERLFICSAQSTGGCSIGSDNVPSDDQKNAFALEWSRFGNISLKKYNNNTGWIEL